MDLEKRIKKLGQGRSGIVLLDLDSAGNPLVRKIFTSGDWLTKAANYVVQGVPNPYCWNEQAIASTESSAGILSDLVEYWFSDKLRVAGLKGHNWNDEYRSWELGAEFVDGRHASLHHQFSGGRGDELGDLVNNVMVPLQRKLQESGFDGLVWQAGLGNPVAANNFLLEGNGKNGYKWVWIDLQSGVPALIPLLFPLTKSSWRHYIPKSMSHKHPLFDDADITKLKAYIFDHEEGLKDKIGAVRYSSLRENVFKLEKNQKEWKSMKRAHRSIGYGVKKENISPEQAE